MFVLFRINKKPRFFHSYFPNPFSPTSLWPHRSCLRFYILLVYCNHSLCSSRTTCTAPGVLSLFIWFLLSHPACLSYVHPLRNDIFSDDSPPSGLNCLCQLGGPLPSPTPLSSEVPHYQQWSTPGMACAVFYSHLIMCMDTPLSIHMLSFFCSCLFTWTYFPAHPRNQMNRPASVCPRCCLHLSIIILILMPIMMHTQLPCPAWDCNSCLHLSLLGYWRREHAHAFALWQKIQSRRKL